MGSFSFDTDLVLHEPCPECGFDAGGVAPDELPDSVLGLRRRFQAPLSRFLPGEDGDAVVRRRPTSDVWSALEYAGHVRDELALYDRRVHSVLDEDDPEITPWDYESAVVDGDYNGADPALVADELALNAEALATTLQLVPAGGWERAGHRPGGRTLTVLDLGRLALHEGHHHLLDVGRALRTARGR